MILNKVIAQDKQDKMIQSNRTQPSITKYENMEKKDLQKELKNLQKQILVAERTSKKTQETLTKARRAYQSASDDEKPDALLCMIKAGFLA